MADRREGGYFTTRLLRMDSTPGTPAAISAARAFT